MREPIPDPGLSALEMLVGEWDMWALGRKAGPFRSSFTWTEGGTFLVQRTDVAPATSVPPEWEGVTPFPTVAVTGYDGSANEFTTLYADGRGVARVYGTAVREAVWTMWRAAPGFHQRFTATVDTAGGTMSGGWETSEDGTEWESDFDVTYVRTG